MNLGLPELAIIFLVVLLFFGPSRLPGLGKSIGSAIRGFKKGISGGSEEDKKSDDNSNKS
jgi:sec-independent protein translocase protein TatA